MMDTQDREIAVVCGANDPFAIPLAVTIYSISANVCRQVPVTFYVLDAGISESNKSRLSKIVEGANRNARVRWVRPAVEKLTGLATPGHLNWTTYLRLLVPSSIPSDVRKAIYVDSDVVVQDDIRKLWDRQFENELVFAVRDFGIPFVSSPGAIPETFLLHGLGAHAWYFNGGVLVMNLVAWRDECIAEKVVAFTVRNSATNRYGDQDGLNAIVGRRWGILDPTWNVQVGALRHLSHVEPNEFKDFLQKHRETLIRHGSVIHFTGPGKPWFSGLRSPATSIFFRYLRECGWMRSNEYRWFYVRSMIVSILWFLNSKVHNSWANFAGAPRKSK